MIAMFAAALQGVLIGEPSVCIVGFDIERQQATNISVECPALDDQSGAEAEIRRMLQAESRWSARNVSGNTRREQPVVVAGISEDGREQWYATGVIVRRVPPRYPTIAAERGQQASCSVRFHSIEGGSEPVAAACGPRGVDDDFARQARRAVAEWRFTNGLPLFCGQTLIEFFLSDGMAELTPPENPACTITSEQIELYPVALRPYAMRISDLLLEHARGGYPADGEYDRQTGDLACPLTLSDVGLSVRCPEEAPEVDVVEARMNARLARVDLRVENDSRLQLSEVLTAQHDEGTGWYVEAGQTVFTRRPEPSPLMNRRRASGVCRAGVLVGETGRATAYDMACVLTINPARNAEIMEYMRNEVLSVLRNTVWLPGEGETCLEIDYDFPHPNPITDRGVPGTQISELPRYCTDEESE